jgi:hypothetical protein
MLLLQLLSTFLEHAAVLGNITLQTMIHYIVLVTQFQPFISQAAQLDFNQPVLLLPTSVTAFLMQALGLNEQAVSLLWRTLLPAIWQFNQPGHETQQLAFIDATPAILAHGPLHDLC